MTFKTAIACDVCGRHHIFADDDCPYNADITHLFGTYHGIHFNAWLGREIPSDDWAAVEEGITAILRVDPELMTEDQWGWSQLYEQHRRNMHDADENEPAYRSSNIRRA